MVCAAGLLAGCAAAADPIDAPRFPTDAALEDIARRTPRREVVAANAVIVDSWALTGPFADTDGHVLYESDTPWFAAVGRALADHPGVATTRGMYCTAREVGRFALAHRSRPAPGLLAFMASRCGSAAVDLVASFAYVRDDGVATPAQLFRRLKPTLDGMLETIGRGDRELGIWLGRAGNSAAMAVVTGAVKLALSRAERAPDANGRLVIEGRALRPIRAMSALMTAGSHGVARCARDPSLALPRFRLVCTPDRGDALAWIDVAVFEPDSRLGKAALKLLVWPRGQPTARYDRPRYAASRPVSDAPDRAAALTELLNQVRASAGLPPLSLAPAQSALATRLAPHYYDALYDQRKQAQLDALALGLIAGRRVGGPVRHGWLSAALIGPSRAGAASGADLGALIDAALEGPYGRESMLGASATTLALGVLYEPRTESLAAVFATYAVVPAGEAGERERAALADTLGDQLAARRRAAGLGPARPFAHAGELLGPARRDIEARGVTPEHALRRLLQRARHRFGDSFSDGIRGWLVYEAQPGAFELPPALVHAPAAEVAFAVAVHAPDGDAWARYALLILARLSR